MSTYWTQEEAIELCRKVEAVCPEFNCHVALTGGLLYKDGSRKDCDLLFYRVRKAELDINGLYDALEQLGFSLCKVGDWCTKASYNNKPVDLFFPEGDDDNEQYP